MAPQRLEKIESAPGNAMGSEASNPPDLVHRRTADRAQERQSRGETAKPSAPCKALKTHKCGRNLDPVRIPRRRRIAAALAERGRPKAPHFPSAHHAEPTATASTVAHGQPHDLIPHLVGSRLPSPYHFRARIQSFQAVAAPFPGDSDLPSASRDERRAPGAAPARRRHGRPRATRSCAGSGGGCAKSRASVERDYRVVLAPERRGRRSDDSEAPRAATGRRLPRQQARGSSRFRPVSTHRRCLPRRFSHFVRFQWFAARKIFPPFDFRHRTQRAGRTSARPTTERAAVWFHRKLIFAYRSLRFPDQRRRSRTIA